MKVIKVELKSCKRRRELIIIKKQRYGFELFIWIGLDLDISFFFFFFFIANARQTSLNPSMNRDQQRREMGGPLVR
jgi:hypothetical protein